MEERKVDLLVCKTMREVIDEINLNGLTKENIIQIVKRDYDWCVIYQK